MSTAVFAIPGLMPPTHPDYDMRVTLPENGEVKLCVHCGEAEDKVHYCLRAHGFAGGAIKDPSYEYPDTPEGRAMASQESQWPQFMRQTQELPSGVQVLKVVRHGKWAIPVTERPDLTEKSYWVLEIPAGILPNGDTELELSINGAVRRYFLKRPHFGAYDQRDITKRYSYLKENEQTSEQ